MASRRLRNRSYSVVIQADSYNRENMEDNKVTYFESDAEETVRENPALEQAEQNANIVFTSSDNVTIFTDSNVDKGSMYATQLQEMLSTLMHTIQSESCKQIAALVATMDCKLTSAIENLKSELRYENEKLAENLIARFESVNVEIREEFNAKLS
jgi:flagellar biosynthesis regulator FlbT